ncbi:MAG: hypothetical protein AB9856_11445 [Cellulosilyticaceae bacterium]
MQNLLETIKRSINLNNKLGKLYLLTFYILNVVYLFLEIIKHKYEILFSGTIDQQKFYFEKLTILSTVTNFIEYLLLIINLIYLIGKLIECRKEKGVGINTYLVVSIVSLLSIEVVHIILSVICSVPYLSQQNILVANLIFVVLIVTLVRRGYNALVGRNRFI